MQAHFSCLEMEKAMGSLFLLIADLCLLFLLTSENAVTYLLCKEQRNKNHFDKPYLLIFYCQKTYAIQFSYLKTFLIIQYILFQHFLNEQLMVFLFFHLIL